MFKFSKESDVDFARRLSGRKDLERRSSEEGHVRTNEYTRFKIISIINMIPGTPMLCGLERRNLGFH
jgi:hypothetical protein